jgi:hypothetical protein
MTLAVLQKDKTETQALDLYINVTQNLTLSVVGAGELHLSGYFEPNRDDLDDGMMMGDEDDEEEEAEEETINGKVNKNLK